MSTNDSNRPTRRPRVVILGAGFGGLYCARHLKRAPVDITLIDRQNHHLFQPLLYQVATAGLSPGDIASPIRHIFSGQRNVEVLLAEAQRVDLESRTVHLADASLRYDWLVLATGARTSYLGRADDWSEVAPGLKTVDDALEIRRRFLMAFEAAEREGDPDARRAELTFVVVGGGPTGVELAGTMSELARRAFIRDFRRIDTTTARIILIQADDRLLVSYEPKLSARARRDLERLGVQVWLNTRVTDIDERGVTIGDERINARNVFWAAGVQATPIGETLGVELAEGGRVPVGTDLSIEGHPEAFVIGDLARAIDETGREVPGIAPGAIQMGRFVSRVIAKEAGGDPVSQRPAFRYVDKGMLATIGRARAVGTLRGLTVTGLVAWLLWLAVHISYLIGFRNRVIVLIQWAWSYFTFQRGARLITGDQRLSPKRAHHRTVESPPEPARRDEHSTPENVTRT